MQKQQQQQTSFTSVWVALCTCWFDRLMGIKPKRD
jgi:hypothetical protein